MTRSSGRRFEAELAPIVKEHEGRLVLRAPRPGWLRHAPTAGRALGEGDLLGELEVLGTLCRLVVPAGVGGLVVEVNEHVRLARKPVAFGDLIAVLDPNAGVGAVARATSAASTTSSGGLVWKTPLGGRYYGRPAPGAEAFVKVGDEIEVGRTVALIEVMKTFNRASYGGPGVPERARVTRILVSEGDDVNAGDAVLALEAV